MESDRVTSKGKDEGLTSGPGTSTAGRRRAGQRLAELGQRLAGPAACGVGPCDAIEEPAWAGVEKRECWASARAEGKIEQRPEEENKQATGRNRGRRRNLFFSFSNFSKASSK